MADEKVLIFFLFQATFVFSAEQAATFSRSSYFTTRENKQLKGYVVKQFDSPSLLSCGQQCMRNAWCTSTNYKMSSKKDGKGTCELNKHDISIINEKANFHVRQGVTFSMLLKVRNLGLKSSSLNDTLIVLAIIRASLFVFMLNFSHSHIFLRSRPGIRH